MVFVTGIPCAGKTYCLSKLKQDTHFNVNSYSFDSYRNKYAKNYKHVDEKLSLFLKEDVSLSDYNQINSLMLDNAIVFLYVKEVLSECMVDDFITYVQKNINAEECGEKVAVEMCPFLLAMSGLKENVLFLSEQRERHIPRLANRYLCNTTEADDLLEYYKQLWAITCSDMKCKWPTVTEQSFEKSLKCLF